MRLLPLVLLPPLLLAGCDPAVQPQQPGGSTTPRYERAATDVSPTEQLVLPVKIGDNGENFPACNARGTTRRIIEGGEMLGVHTSPFSGSKEVAELPAGASFFICSRSLDQQWFGIVFDAAGKAAPECGVLAPVPSRRDYAGSCKSGWVSSAFVKVTAD